MAKKKPQTCELISFADACEAFVANFETQGSAHIRRMHWYVASRLVVEGGFDPDTLKPHPPFRIETKGKARYLIHDEKVANSSEAKIFGGLKTKNVDVVASINGVGPCIAISMKGTLKAYRNLTNRMEEAVGDCTNLHMSYPGLVYGFLHLIRANPQGLVGAKTVGLVKVDGNGCYRPQDTAVGSAGVTSFISTYHNAIARLTGRRDLRDDVTRYEAVCLLLVSPDEAEFGSLYKSYPLPGSLLHFDSFFRIIYEQYDTRFVYGSPGLRAVTYRHFWHPDSPALKMPVVAEMSPRISEADLPPPEEEADEDPDEEPDRESS